MLEELFIAVIFFILSIIPIKKSSNKKMKDSVKLMNIHIHYFTGRLCGNVNLFTLLITVEA